MSDADTSLPARSASRFGVPVCLCLAAAIAYLPLLHAGFVWDDDSTLTGNPLVHSLHGLYRLWFTTDAADYWPVSSTTLWIEWHLWHMHAWGYHATNLALHLANTLLVWTILRQLRIPGATLAALLFAVHPLNAEAVAWIAQRKTLLAMLFFLISTASYLRAETGPGCVITGTGCVGKRWYWLSLGGFVLAMLSKGSVAPLPLVLLGVIAWHRPVSRSDLLRLGPFFLVAVVFVSIDIWFQRHGSVDVIRNADLLDRTLGAGACIGFYICKILLPINLSFIYPLWDIRPESPLWWIPALGAVGVTWWLVRGGRSRPALFAWGYFCVMLLPVMGFADVYYMRYSLVANHYAYVAIPGVLAFAAFRWTLWNQQPSRWPVAVAAAVLVLLTALTWCQVLTYRNARTLFAATLKQNPGCWMAHNYIGAELFPAGQRSEAINHFEEAVRLKPDYAEGHFNLGNALSLTDRSLGAIAEYELALRYKHNYPEARYYLANELTQSGQLPEAIAQYERLERETGMTFGVENNLGNALAKVGKPQDAIAHYKQALSLEPRSAPTHANLGNALAAAGHVPEAAAEYELALELDPKIPKVHYYLSLALRSLGRTAEADAQLDAAMLLNQK